MLCFFRSLIDFDWIKGHLISDRVGSDQFDFLKKLDHIGFGSDLDPDGSDRFLESDWILSPLVVCYLAVSSTTIMPVKAIILEMKYF
jgi:hypothetical protein